MWVHLIDHFIGQMSFGGIKLVTGKKKSLINPLLHKPQCSTCGVKSRSWYTRICYICSTSDPFAFFVQEGDTCCVQEPAAWSHPHDALHGGGGGRVRPRRHHGVGPVEVGSSTLGCVLAGGRASRSWALLFLPPDALAPFSIWKGNSAEATAWRWNCERSWRGCSRQSCCTRRSSEYFLTLCGRRGETKWSAPVSEDSSALPVVRGNKTWPSFLLVSDL